MWERERETKRNLFTRSWQIMTNLKKYDKFTKAFNKNALAKTKIPDFFATHLTSKIRIKKYSFSHLK